MPRTAVYTPEEAHARKLQSQAKYRRDHMEKARAVAKEFYYANKERITAYRKEARARKKLEKLEKESKLTNTTTETTETPAAVEVVNV